MTHKQKKKENKPTSLSFVELFLFFQILVFLFQILLLGGSIL